MDARRLACMRPEAVLIKRRARSHWDEPALVEALQSGKIAEPPWMYSSTRPLPRIAPCSTWHVMLAPHNANSSPSGLEAGALEHPAQTCFERAGDSCG